MAEPHAIALVPTEAGRALTADGPWGARPPLVVVTVPHGTYLSGQAFDGAPVANGLPLWWAGKPVPDGVFRAWQAWDPDASPEAEAAFEATGWTTYDVLGEALDSHSPHAALWLARALESAGLCRVVVLDLVDGALVERAP